MFWWLPVLVEVPIPFQKGPAPGIPTPVDRMTDERDNPYYFFPANQQKASTKIYSLTLCSLSVNECDWHILAGNDKRINTHCLTRDTRENITFLQLRWRAITTLFTSTYWSVFA